MLLWLSGGFILGDVWSTVARRRLIRSRLVLGLFGGGALYRRARDGRRCYGC